MFGTAVFHSLYSLWIAICTRCGKITEIRSSETSNGKQPLVCFNNPSVICKHKWFWLHRPEPNTDCASLLQYTGYSSIRVAVRAKEMQFWIHSQRDDTGCWMHKIEWTGTTTNNNKQKLNLLSETSYALTVSFTRIHTRWHRLGVDVAGEHWISLPFGYLSLAFCLACCFLSAVRSSEQPLATAMEPFFYYCIFFIASKFPPNIHIRNFYICSICSSTDSHFISFFPFSSVHSIDCSWRLILLHFISLSSIVGEFFMRLNAIALHC